MNSQERREVRYQRRKHKRYEKRLEICRTSGSFEDIFTMSNLYDYCGKVCKGVGWKTSTQVFRNRKITESYKLYRDLKEDKYKSKGFYEFTLSCRGKTREIKSVHISERVVQKLACEKILLPAFRPSFIYDNYASLKDRGTDFAIERLKVDLMKYYRKSGNKGYILLYDFSSFFATSPHTIIYKENAKRIYDMKCRKLCEMFMENFGPVGYGLGSQISQTDNLMVPSPLDHSIKQNLLIDGYGRYMDDGRIIHEDLNYIKKARDFIIEKSKEIGLTINLKKTKICRIDKGFKFLQMKFRLIDTGKVLIKMRRNATTIMRSKLRKFKDWLKICKLTILDVLHSYNSYRGYMNKGNSYKILCRMDDYFISMFKEELSNVRFEKRWYTSRLCRAS